NTVFGVTQLPGVTLLGALQLTGNGQNALARQAVAALLSAAHTAINYFYSEAQVIALARAGFANSNIVDTTTNALQPKNERGSHSALGSGGTVGSGTPFGANVAALIQQNGQYAVRINPAAVASRANRAVTLDAGPTLRQGSDLPLPFHRLVADFN